MGVDFPPPPIVDIQKSSSISLVLYIQSVCKNDLFLRNGEVLVLVLGKMGIEQEGTSYLFNGKIIIERLCGDTPSDKVKEPGSFHSKFQPSLPLKGGKGSWLIPNRDIHSR